MAKKKTQATKPGPMEVVDEVPKTQKVKDMLIEADLAEEITAEYRNDAGEVVKTKKTITLHPLGAGFLRFARAALQTKMEPKEFQIILKRFLAKRTGDTKQA